MRRRPSKSTQAWDLLRKRETIRNPKKFLEENVSLSRARAKNFLTNLEAFGYARMKTNSRGIPQLHILRKDDLPLGLTTEIKAPPLKTPQPDSLNNFSKTMPSLPAPAPQPAPPEVNLPVQPDAKPKTSNIVVLLDYRNFLKYAQRFPESEGLKDHEIADKITQIVLDRAKKKGNVKWSFSFVPSNTCQPERTYIFKNGFTVLDGPQTKIDRKDTCDAMLEEMASLFLESERCYDTFIIASHDGDFRRIKNKIENHNRKFILFHLGGANADLLENGTINEDLSEFIWEALGKIKPKPLDLEALAESEPHKGPDSKPHFSEVLRVLSQDGFPEKCLHSALLSAIVSTLLEKNYATGNPWDGKNFIVLKKLVWE